jgi:hypothetical protein
MTKIDFGQAIQILANLGESTGSRQRRAIRSC